MKQVDLGGLIIIEHIEAILGTIYEKIAFSKLIIIHRHTLNSFVGNLPAASLFCNPPAGLPDPLAT